MNLGSRLATIVEGISADDAARVRSRLAFTRYTLLDRGLYEFADDVDEPALLAQLLERASRLTGRSLAVRQARALRFVPGDYLYAHHDQVHDDLPLELVLDLSPTARPADIHYRRRGNVFFHVPCAPGSLAIVERGPAVTRNFAYLSKLHAGDVTRLVVLTSDA